MFSGITVTCFAASYAVAFGLEITRLFFRLAVRLPIMIAFTGAGLFAHTMYLWSLTQADVPLSSWYDWCLMAAWVLAATYLGFIIRRPENAVGVFLLPMILVLIGLAAMLRESAPFPRPEAISLWRVVHGSALLIGTVAVSLGFVAGVMYLVQSYRLKHKLPPRPGFRLPSLERLQQFNRSALFLSTCLLAVGLLSGIVLNLINRSRAADTIGWSDPVVWTSGMLFLWLVAAMLFEYFYKPARQGRKVAYMTLASFIFLGLALGSVLLGDHASSEPDETAQAPSTVSEASARPVGDGP